MKKKIFTFMLGSIAALASCSRSDEIPGQPQEGDRPVTFTVEAPATTRASVSGLTRYIVEAYEGKDLTGDPLRAESASGTLSVTLKKNTEYTLLFWADKGTEKTESAAGSGYWDAASLLAVSAADASGTGQAAYCLKIEINSKNLTPNHAVVLKNATAQANFVEAAGLQTAGNTLKVTYAAGATLNVATGKTTPVAEPVTHTFTNIGQAATDDILATDYVLAPLAEKNVLNLVVQLNAEPQKAIANVPFEQNYKTNIKGEYSNLYACAFTVSNQVEDYGNNPDIGVGSVQAGDYYLSDGTLISKDETLSDAQKATCTGIVFEVNADGKSGKIVGVTQSNLAWSTENVATGATDRNDGRANMATIARYIADNGKSWDDYPAFKRVAQQNGHTDGGWDESDPWYLPTLDELSALYSTRLAVNASLAAIGAEEFAANFYWASSERTWNDAHVRDKYNNEGSSYKYGIQNVLCIRKF